MIQLQERDRKILRVGYEQRFLMMGHLIQFHFKGRHIGEAYRRVKELKESGFLEDKCFWRFKVLRLTAKGRELARLESPWELPSGLRINPSRVEHEAQVTRLRLRLEELWDGVWKPASCIRDRPVDGEVHFRDGKRVGLLWGGDGRTRSEWDAWLRDFVSLWRDYFCVVVVFKQASAHERLKRLILEQGITHPIFLGLEEDLFSDPPRLIWFFRGDVIVFNLRSFE